MNIFQLKTTPHGIERFAEFINDEFICIGWPGIGDLNQLDKDEIRNRLKETYGYTSHQLGNALGRINAFVNTMKKGDTVLVKEKDWVHVGTVGDYKYEQKYDNEKDGMCHRRSVEWKEPLQITEIRDDIQKLIRNRITISKYPESVEVEDIIEFLKK